MIKIIPAAISCLLLFAGCETTSKITTAPVAATAKNSASKALLDSVRMHAFYFDWFTGKAKVEVLQGTDKTEFTASLRMRQDSAIWVSISPALGIEAARVLMTKDSVHIIDRINNEQYSTDYHIFNQYTSLPVTFSLIQDLITGAPLIIGEQEFVVAENDSAYILQWQNAMQSNRIAVDRNFRPVEQHITDSTMAGVNITQRQYDIPYTSPFSLWRKIEMIRPRQMEIILTFSKIRINEPVKLPFNGKD
ncbi:MAG: DUF4292 domain-containing protein [Chitinophagales bacterium]|nr:DUF4292 domain-containing protein [Chitinophagales bacterium]